MTIDELREELCQVSSLMFVICTAVNNELSSETEFLRSLPAALDGVYQRLDTLWGEVDKLEMEEFEHE